MASSDWLFALLIVTVMTSPSREQTASCAMPQVQMAKGAPPWPNVTTGPPAGVGYLGRGFDVYTGNLLSAGTDPGFRLPVVLLNYQDGHLSADARYVMPASSDFRYATAARYDTVTEIRSRLDVLRLIAGRIKLETQDLQDGRFMASGAYVDFLSADESSSVLYAIDETPRYSVSFDSSRLLATQAFRDEVRQLPSSCRKVDVQHYMQFIRKYGTHVITQLTLGEMTASSLSVLKQELMGMKRQGKSLTQIYNTLKKAADQTRSNKQVVPLGVSIEGMQNFLSPAFMGEETTGLISKRQCLTEILQSYCTNITRSACSAQDGTSNFVRYGDRINLSSDNDGSVFMEDGATILDSQVVSRLVKGMAQMAGSLQVLPPRGEERRLGTPLYVDDIFTLGSLRGAEWRVQMNWTNSNAYTPSTTSPVYFTDVTHSPKSIGSWQLYTPADKGHPCKLTIKTSPEGITATSAGPWLITMDITGGQIISEVIDPCYRFCHPGGVVSTTVLLPIELSSIVQIERITISEVPRVLGIQVRPGSWLVVGIQITDLVNMATFTTSSEFGLIYPCPGLTCLRKQWSLSDNTLLHFGPNSTERASALDAEFYFQSGSDAPVAVSDSSTQKLNLVGYSEMVIPDVTSCSKLSCLNGGRCHVKELKASCICSSMWSGPSCNLPCSAELFNLLPGGPSGNNLSLVRDIYGSYGEPSTTALQWIFTPPAQGLLHQGAAKPFVLIVLPTMAKVSAITAPQDHGLRQIDIEYFDIKTQVWSGNVTSRPSASSSQSPPSSSTTGSGQDRTFLLSVHGSGSLVTDKIRFIYRGGGAALDLTGVVIYGCSSNSNVDFPSENSASNLLTPSSFKVTKVVSYPPRTYDSIQSFSRNLLLQLKTEELLLQIPVDNDCGDLDKSTILWAIAEQVDLCPSNLEVTNFTNTPNTKNSNMQQNAVQVTLTLQGEPSTISNAKFKVTNLVRSGNLTLLCQGQRVTVAVVRDSKNDVMSGDNLASLDQRVTVLTSVVIALVVLCLIVFIIFLIVMSRRYRDIKNEVTTLRKLEMQKRMAKRQELQPQIAAVSQVPYMSSTLPRPNSVTSGSTTTSIPGRSNGQTRPLRYSQSLHGLSDRARLTAVNQIGSSSNGRGNQVDAGQYVINPPSGTPVVRTPSPVGTRSGEESDTVQSIC